MSAQDAARQIGAVLPYSHGLIRLSVSEGEATLEGTVEWRYQKERAEAAVRRVPGIETVNNLLLVKPKVQPLEIKRAVGAAGGEADSRSSMRSWVERRLTARVRP